MYLHVTATVGDLAPTEFPESIEVNEINALIRQKRQELELSWFPNTLPGNGRVGSVPWSVETAVLPLVSSVLPRTIFPASTMSLENFGNVCELLSVNIIISFICLHKHVTVFDLGKLKVRVSFGYFCNYLGSV